MDPRATLSHIGTLDDADVDLAEVALSLSALAHPGLDLGRYRQHLKALTCDVADRHAALVAAGAVDGNETRLAALKHIVADQYGYSGDLDRFDDLQNADLVRVIDRRKGLPVALSILTLIVGRAQGWVIDGLNFPGHFLLRLDSEGQRLLFDPFGGFRILQAAGLRDLIKKALGPDAELSARFYESASNREILLRLQNNIKLRQIESENYVEALDTVETMRLFAPRDLRLWLDCGVLRARAGRIPEAISILEEYVAALPRGRDRADVELLLRNLRDAPR